MTAPWGPDPAPITESVVDRIESDDIITRYPMLKETTTSNLHSIILSYYVLLGDLLGQIPVAEYTIYDKGYQQALGKNPTANGKRADSVWLNPETNEETAAVEFEYWDEPDDVPEKARHLVTFSEMVESIDLVILHYWDTVGHANEIDQIKNYFSEEYMYKGDPYELRADALIIETVFEEQGSSLSHAYTEIQEVCPSS